MRQYFHKGRYIIAGTALLLVACGSDVRDSWPSWARRDGFTEAAASVRLQGKWKLNESLSDDPEPLIRRAVAALKRNRSTVLSGDLPERGRDRRPGRIGEDPYMAGTHDSYGDAALSDPRLAALRAKEILIEQGEEEVRFAFDGAPPVSYLVNQATSTDQNINLTFADWEGSQFVVEKNGPSGLVLERWVLAPDSSQLYLAVSVEIKMPDFPLPAKPVLIGRMFDKVE